MFNRYYQDELSFVRELGRQFAAANPTLAPMLAERSSDPDVERLLEGFAFLTARIRERIDDAVPELVESLIELVLPHFSRPLPAASILEFQPVPGTLRRRETIPKGTEVASRSVNVGPRSLPSCRFRTTTEVDVVPLAITHLALEEPLSTRPALRMVLEATAKDGLAEVFHPRGLRFFISGEHAAATTFLCWVLRHLQSVTVQGPGATSPTLRLGPKVVRAPGLDRTSPLFPFPEVAFDGYRVLQEYLTLPEKLLFFELSGLEAARSGASGDRVELLFRFAPSAEGQDPPRLPASIGRTFLRLHCAPVVNLFPAAAEPVRRRGHGIDHLLRPASIDPAHVEVFTVDRVLGVRSGRSKPQEYQPFASFLHDAGSEYYRLRRSRSIVDGGLDTYLSISSPRDGAPDLAGREDLSIDLTCTNRSSAGELAAGDISVSTPSSPTFASFKNITGVSRPARPPLDADLSWRLVAHLAIQRRSLAERDVLASLLAIHDFSGSTDEQVSRANRMRIESIRTVGASEARKLVRGAPVRGVKTTIELEEKGFAGPGDAFLFGLVLDELLASRVSLNSFNELILRIQPSNRTFRWAPRSGRQEVV